MNVAFNANISESIDSTETHLLAVEFIDKESVFLDEDPRKTSTQDLFHACSHQHNP